MKKLFTLAVSFIVFIDLQAQTETDNWVFWDYTGSRVYTEGTVRWWWAPQYHPKGNILPNSRVTLNRQGCLWVKVTWNKVGVNISWPPSGGANTVSDGYYRACGEKGTTIWLPNINHTAWTLISMTICIGYSPYYQYEVRGHDACKKMSMGNQ